VNYYCSYADRNYLSKLSALVSSLDTFENSAVFYVLFLDQESQLQSARLFGGRVKPISIGELESHFPELLLAKKGRSAMEYVFTLTPYLMKWVQEKTTEGDLTIYLDSDLFFFASPKLVVDELGSSDVGIIPHQYPETLAPSLRKYGKFNVGWVAMRNSSSGRRCLDWWASQCLDWCGDEPLDGKYADQGYLDQFPNLFEGVKVLENRGFNLAPWNTKGQAILKDSDGRVTLGDHTPLTFFHFHGLKRLGKWMVTSQLNYRSPASKSLVENVYKPYLRALQSAEKELENTKSGRPTQKLVRGKGFRKWARNLVGKLLMIASVLTGNAVDMSRLK
jgi:hypothetical protein